MKNENIDKFVEEYGALTQKYGVDFAAYPQFVPDGEGGFKIVCQVVPMELKPDKVTLDSFIPKNG